MRVTGLGGLAAVYAGWGGTNGPTNHCAGRGYSRADAALQAYAAAAVAKLYSQDLLDNLFQHPYTKIDFLMADLHVTRLTATRYLDLLSE